MFHTATPSEGMDHFTHPCDQRVD